MKRTFLALTAIAAVLAVPALADSTWQPGVKSKPGYTRSGYEIPGCAHYESIGTTHYQVCNERSVAPSKVTGRPVIFERDKSQGTLTADK